ncbi:MAG: RNA-binding S4 domain-containing protein [Clostridia bacterium]|nr:RNA-binding S4 domain-containing protein [Clostridia bacterium]
MNKQTITIETDYIRLDSLLKLSGIAETGGHAKVIIQGGGVVLNGAVCTERGKKIRVGDIVATRDGAHAIEVASR